MRVSELKTEMDGRFVDLKTDMDVRFTDVKREMGQRFADVKRETDRRFADVQEQIAVEGEATRRYFDVVIVQLRTEFRLLVDKVTSMDEKMDRYAVTNAQEHSVFRRALDDHEVRLKIVERREQ